MHQDHVAEEPDLIIVAASARGLAAQAVAAGFRVTAFDLFGDYDLAEIATIQTIRDWPNSIAEQISELVGACPSFSNPLGMRGVSPSGLTGSSAARGVSPGVFSGSSDARGVSPGVFPGSSDVRGVSPGVPLGVPVLLGGGLENAADQIRAIAARHPILGPNADQVEAVRTLENLVSWTAEAGLPMPKMEPVVCRCDDSRQWLWKPRKSCGGMGIRMSTFSKENHQIGGGYFQELIAGTPIGAAILCLPKSVASPDPSPGTSRVRFLGASQSLTSAQWNGPAGGSEPFIYRGSLGPIDLPVSIRERLLRLATIICEKTDFAGWLQVDGLLTEDGQFFVLEINPRWSAGMEVVAAQSSQNMVVDIAEAFGIATARRAPESRSGRGTPPGVKQCDYPFVGKGICYSPVSGVTTERQLEFWLQMREKYAFHHSIPALADIPQIGTLYQAGQPLVTVAAGADSISQLLDRLKQLRALVIESLSVCN